MVLCVLAATSLSDWVGVRLLAGTAVDSCLGDDAALHMKRSDASHVEEAAALQVDEEFQYRGGSRVSDYHYGPRGAVIAYKCSFHADLVHMRQRRRIFHLD